MADTPKRTRSGSAFFGEKDLQYLQKVSRQAVEKHTNTEVLYFELDVEKSRRNLYGEMTIKRFKNPKGVKVKGVITINESSAYTIEGIPDKLATLDFSVYRDHLEEIGVDPRIGDYFSIKDRLYQIYDRTLKDISKTSIGIDRKNMAKQFRCVQADDEQIVPELFGDSSKGTKNDIEP